MSAAKDHSNGRASIGFALPATRAGSIGMRLFLAALAMLFFAAMLGYLAARLGPANRSRAGILVPWTLWLSTAALLAAGATIELAKRMALRQKQAAFRFAMRFSLLCSLLFVAVQVPSLWTLLTAHGRMKAQGIGLYGLVFTLILLHAAHVIGGLIPMSVLTWRAGRSECDPEQHLSLQNLAMYWHFLHVVWVVMFGVFLAVG